METKRENPTERTPARSPARRFWKTLGMSLIPASIIISLVAMVLYWGHSEIHLDGHPLIILEALTLATYWLARTLIGHRPPMPKDWPDSLKQLVALARGQGYKSTAATLRLIDVPLLMLAILAAVIGALDDSNRAPLSLFLLHAAVLLAFLAEFARVARHAMAAIPGAAAFPISFLLLIITCTLLLKLPISTPSGITWTDALFTGTSAVCVTGLVVRDTAAGFTQTGQAIILTFIQLGGLGIVLFGAGLAVMFRRSLSLREHVSIREMLDRESIGDLRRFIGFVLLTTLVIQALAIAAMTPLWVPADGQTLALQERVWLSTFHTINAFSLAGFDITGESLIGHRNALLPYLVVIPLIITGGLGFPVLHDLWKKARSLRRPSNPRALRHATLGRLSLHTKITLLATGIVLVLGFLGIALAQALTQHDHQRAWHGVIADAAFLSVTARTGGLTTVPADQLAPATIIVLMALMFIGGSPGSFAGGMKVTTLALLALSILATIRGRAETEAFGRAIPETLIRKAGAIALSMLLLPLFTTFGLAITDPGPLSVLMFEAISAATTTGLSLGITDSLSDSGKQIITMTMYLGRIGPLALMGALILHKPPSRAYLYPRETVNLG